MGRISKFSIAYFAAVLMGNASLVQEVQALEVSSEEAAKHVWYDLLTPTINGISKAQLVGKEQWVREVVTRVDDVATHEGGHQMDNLRYKEWWYVDIQTDEGFTLSFAVVLSAMQEHLFLWFRKPSMDHASIELEGEDHISVNPFGTTQGVALEGTNVSLKGDSENGYVLEFAGRTHSGTIDLAPAVPPIAQRYDGINKTYYATYQLPKLIAKGEIVDRVSGEVFEIDGQSYHDHVWGIVNRYDEWNWLQARMDNGWIVSFYVGNYGWLAGDHHHYAWLYRPEVGYTFFDPASVVVEQGAQPGTWLASASGEPGQIAVSGTTVVRRYWRKDAELSGLRIGEVDYRQNAIVGQGELVDQAGIVTPLVSRQGMVEGDCFAIW